MIQNKLLLWYDQHARELPWRATCDPYKIWISEVILQQTRVGQGMEYYHHFISAYPTVHELAQAPEQQILKSWQGLGYYSRARNLHKAAKIIVAEYGGQLPDNFADLLGLPGIGVYTAGAIASIAHNERVPVVDGNVYRVLSRIFDLDDPIDTGPGKKKFNMLAKRLISEIDKPGNYNQSLMELGAVICTPKSPQCSLCVLNENCLALANNTVQYRPVKSRKVKVEKRTLHYFLVFKQNMVMVRERKLMGIWNKLYDFPGTDQSLMTPTDSKETSAKKIFHLADGDFECQSVGSLDHKLTHKHLEAHFYHLKTKATLKILPDCKWQNVEDFEDLPIPRLIHKFWTTYRHE